ncbi:hypothetical protein MPSEU_000128800 [Mayamaea pseudoterrestris]|nr:hypothetical protein MPSEU_000128800 [Mayamaea pseudoterrestris]
MNTSLRLLITCLLVVRHSSWDPLDDHPCNIKRISHEALMEQFGSQGLPPLYQEPIVILASSTRNVLFTQFTRPELIGRYLGPDFNVTLSSSNSLSEHRREMRLQTYIDETIASRETKLEQNSNESWYLFGETYGSDWKRLLANYELPPCVACTPHDVALSFGIGNIGSGVQWHVHGPGFSEAIHGRKHWVMYPKEHPPVFHKDESSRQWMEHKYPQAKQKPLECTLNPGDLVYFPDRYWHATINLDPYTAFVSTFTQEHQFAVAMDEL